MSTPSPVRIAVVMACHNRVAGTLTCLESLYAQIGLGERFDLAVHLLDDASTDGTAAAVRGRFPDARVIRGDGTRFWGGGMVLAMRSADAEAHDVMLWLNDDVQLDADAISVLLDDHRTARARAPDKDHIVIGRLIDPGTGRIRYGGLRRRSRWHPARIKPTGDVTGSIVPCDTMNGNLVLVPRGVIETIGHIDPVFVHHFGDIDYGYRAHKAGVGLWASSRPVGLCRDEPRPAPWSARGLTLRQRWAFIDTPLGRPIVPWVTFMWRHGGLLAVASLMVSYGRELFPTRR